MSDCFVRLGFLDSDEDPEPLLRIVRMVFGPVLEDKIFDPRHFHSLETAWAALSIGMESRLLRASGHRVFLWRALVGLDAYMKQFGTVTNWHRELKQAVARVRD